ncbi:MAG: ABC transporter substrate-binding protein, partial [Desulfobacteraceae bacterium]|nr:ABC transporter substrate-binding protein [Desulfobacteraceae bacterium]
MQITHTSGRDGLNRKNSLADILFPPKRAGRCLVEKRVRGLLIFWLALMFLAGCGSHETEPVSNAIRTGGTLYVGVETPFYGLDILGGGGGILIPDMVMVNNLIQEPLFRMDHSGTLIPVLGLSAAPSADGHHWEIHLRQGVRFHDGTPFAADSVVHHWSRMLDPQSDFRGRKLFQPIERVEKVDPHTVRFV